MEDLRKVYVIFQFDLIDYTEKILEVYYTLEGVIDRIGELCQKNDTFPDYVYRYQEYWVK
jgi:hypothetical protein